MTRFILPLLLLLALPARAATLGGATLPDTYPVAGKSLVLNGIGLRTLTILHIRAYVAALYLEQRSGDAEQILRSPGTKVVLLQFLHSASKEQVETQYREGEANNCGHNECDPRDKADFERLVAAAPAVAVGDTLTYIFSPGRVQVFANNRPIGDFANADLAYRLLLGFIGPRPPSPELKQQLLGHAQ